MTDIIPLDEKVSIFNGFEVVLPKDIKLALQNFQYELDELLNNDQDTFMNIDLCCQRWVYGILPLFKKHFGTSFTETSPSNFCEKGMQETLSATEKSLNALYEAVKYSQEQL